MPRTKLTDLPQDLSRAELLELRGAATMVEYGLMLSLISSENTTGGLQPLAIYQPIVQDGPLTLGPLPGLSSLSSAQP